MTVPGIQPIPRRTGAESVGGWVGFLVVGTPLAAAIGVVLYAATLRGHAGWEAIGVSCGIAAGAAAGGAMLGFLFGIPRTLQGDGSPAGDGTAYRANTNLEQISDWLTKILVGVGLVELGRAGPALGRLINTAAVGLGDTAAARTIVAALLVVFTVWGFLVSYLVTRTQLAKVLSESDIAAITQRTVSEVGRKLDEQAVADAKALALVEQTLNPTDGTPTPTQQDLDEALKEASLSVRLNAFVRANRQRRANWQTNSAKTEATIPVFRSLIVSDTTKTYHRNHAELGYALKDSRVPKWQEAEAALTEAIKRRGPVSKGSVMYEFNRAICRIALAPEGESPPEIRGPILDDLRVVARRDRDMKLLIADPRVRTWIAANHVEAADLTPSTDP